MTTIPDTLTDPTALEFFELERDGTRAIVTTQDYRLELPHAYGSLERAPYALLFDAEGEPWTELSLFSSVDTASGPDECWLVDSVTLTQPTATEVVIRVATRSTAWERHETVLRCTPTGVELSVEVSGQGNITEVTLLGGRASIASGASGTFRSLIAFSSVFVPAATEPVQLVRPAQASAALGVVGDADPGRLHAIFSPPPLALGLGRNRADGATAVPDGDWLSVSLRAPVAELGFTTMHYEPLGNGFLIRLDYEGHTAVDGEWASPVLVLRPATSAWAVLDDYRDDLIESGFATAEGPTVAPWWLEPIFCGWGAQVARSLHFMHGGQLDPLADTAPQSLEEEGLAVRGAPAFARQEVYDEFLDGLSQHDLRPGTIVIDDRWQAEYGTASVNEAAWPDLGGWIAERHAAGQKVLLWWKAWDPEGIPPDECIRDAGGRPVAVDPANPAYQARLAAIVTHLLSPDGLDADGFKVDFTQRTPSGQTLTGTPGTWGIAALHLLLTTLRTAAKAAKPDALVICHAMHPSFADASDMIRLNDVSKFDVHGVRVPVVDQLTFRHEIARRALPAHPIDTDQWPMPNRAEWLRYADAQVDKGVPALYYLEAIDRSGEHIRAEDLARVAASWARYREAIR